MIMIRSSILFSLAFSVVNSPAHSEPAGGRAPLGASECALLRYIQCTAVYVYSEYKILLRGAAGPLVSLVRPSFTLLYFILVRP